MESITIEAQPGPQTEFEKCSADIVWFGGQAGGGKSWILTKEAARNAYADGYRAILFRRTSDELAGLWDESQNIYPFLGWGGKDNQSKLRWDFRTGARIKFSHMQHEKDRKKHQGLQYAFIGFDELEHFTKAQYKYLVFSRNRTKLKMRPYVRATMNPVAPDDEVGGWIHDWIAWWLDEEGFIRDDRSGIIRWFVWHDDKPNWGDSREELLERFPGRDPLSFTFIRSRLSDNKYLMADPSYREKLLSLDRVERERLIGGNWFVRPAAGMYFRRSYFDVVDKPPDNPITRVRAWDLAGSEPNETYPDPDWTAGVKYSRDQDGTFYIEDVIFDRLSPAGVEALVSRTAAQDGDATTVVMWRDPAQAGKYQEMSYGRILSAYTVKFETTGPEKGKVTIAGPPSSQAEQGNIKLVRGPWIDRVLSELENFPDGKHDDIVDALSLAHMHVADDGDDWLMRIN